ncbi:Tubulin-specific chaperone cofactor E-like protein [Orchesella cincta]|uniref:Tubulin-specific chaperone cofactor E-like protein n=1 Tax=Orchesella cincta TaxID=48709 RepID=A0A1D2MIG8_ORCCI|nr:Tubulin-specific chaperone cofactor E-like protein [Orchesella cincta]
MPTLAEAICGKYFNETEDQPNTGVEFVIFAPKSGILQCVPHLLVITASDIDSAGDPELLKKHLSCVLEIDISRNNLQDFREVGKILEYAPKVVHLNLGFNDFSSPSIPAALEFPAVDSLTTLILVGTNIKWPSVWFFLKHAKNVSELHLSLNKFDHIQLCDSGVVDDDSGSNTSASHVTFDVVKNVMFDDNPISSWAEISKLGEAFPFLEHLSLIKCSIAKIPNDCGSKFKALNTLWLSNSLIADMEDVENLKSFPSLTNIRINGVPFLNELADETRRQHFIALLPNIQTLNRGRRITEEDRETAERNFIRYYLDHSEPPSRYHDLVKQHGEVPKLVDVNLGPVKKVKLVIFMDDKEVARVTVDTTKTMSELRVFLEPIVGIRAFKMDLYYLDVGLNFGKEKMTFLNRKLYNYNMRDNDEIYIEKRK